MGQSQDYEVELELGSYRYSCLLNTTPRLPLGGERVDTGALKRAARKGGPRSLDGVAGLAPACSVG